MVLDRVQERLTSKCCADGQISKGEIPRANREAKCGDELKQIDEPGETSEIRTRSEKPAPNSTAAFHADASPQRIRGPSGPHARSAVSPEERRNKGDHAQRVRVVLSRPASERAFIHGVNAQRRFFVLGCTGSKKWADSGHILCRYSNFEDGVV